MYAHDFIASVLGRESEAGEGGHRLLNKVH